MAWNQQTNESARQRKARKPVSLYALAALACLAVISASLLIITREEPQTDKPSPKAAKSRSEDIVSTRKPTPPSIPPVVEDDKTEIPYWEVDASQTNGFTTTMQKKWEHRHRPKYEFNNPTRKPRAKYRIFSHRSENEIAALLMATPGASMIGRPNYHGLTEDFMKSCEEPIVVSPDDDEYTQRLKRDMIQAKIEVRQRMADGETLEKIIEETRAEYRKLSEYKRTLTKEVMDIIRKEDVSVEDIDNFVDAANKMLDAKGISPIKVSNITKQWIINNKGDL